MKVERQPSLEPARAAIARSVPASVAGTSASSAGTDSKRAFEQWVRKHRSDVKASRIEALQALPEADDPGIFGNRRSRQILQYLMDEAVPTLATDHQTRHLTLALLQEELQHYQVLAEQLDEPNDQASDHFGSASQGGQS